MELRNDEWREDRLVGQGGFRLSPTGEQQFTLGPEPLRLPMRSVTERDEFPLALRGLLDDLRNACGLPHVEQFEIDLNTAVR